MSIKILSAVPIASEGEEKKRVYDELSFSKRVQIAMV